MRPVLLAPMVALSRPLAPSHALSPFFWRSQSLALLWRYSPRAKSLNLKWYRLMDGELRSGYTPEDRAATEAPREVAVPKPVCVCV
jgi:hypothetical protein